jgi:hypothetical protein
MAATVVRPPIASTHSGRAPAIMLGLAMLVGLGFVAGFAFPYFAGGEALGQYRGKETWIFMHLGGGMIALLVGPGQLWLGHKNRKIEVHRKLGLVYMGAIAVSVTAAFYLATHTALGWVFGAGLMGLAIAWIVTTGMAFVAVRRSRLDQHQEWMIRSYVVTFAFVTFRAMFALLHAAQVGTRAEQFAMASWFCWAVPLLVVESVIQGRRIFGRGAEAPLKVRVTRQDARVSAAR